MRRGDITPSIALRLEVIYIDAALIEGRFLTTKTTKITKGISYKIFFFVFFVVLVVYKISA